MRNHFFSPAEMNWSNTTWAPLAKSPNCASHKNERVRLGERIAVFEAEHRLFRQHRVDDFVARLAVADVVQRDVTRFSFLIDQHGMALRERAALAVLAGQTNRKAIIQQRAKGERLGGRPVNPFAVLDRRAAAVEEAQYGLMNIETVRSGGDSLADQSQPIEIYAGLATAIIVGNVLGRFDARPTPVEPIGLVGGIGLTSLDIPPRAADASPSASCRPRPE